MNDGYNITEAWKQQKPLRPLDKDNTTAIGISNTTKLSQKCLNIDNSEAESETCSRETSDVFVDALCDLVCGLDATRMPSLPRSNESGLHDQE